MTTSVSIVKGGMVEERVAKALDLIDAKGRLVLRSDSKILIKPNLARVPAESKYAKYKGAYELTTLRNRSAGEGDITHPEVVRAVLKAFRDMGFDNLFLGEAAGGCWTELVYKAYNIYEMAREFNVKVTDLNWEDAVKVSVPGGVVLDHVWVPKTVFEADLLVSLPAWKCWGQSVSLSLKNIGIGVLPGKFYGWSRAGSYVKGLDEPIHRAETRRRFGDSSTDLEVLDVLSVVPIGLAIIDGTTVVHGDQHADRADVVFAGFDPVATDAVAVACMSLDPRRFGLLELASKKGLGTSDLSKIDVRGESIENVKLKVSPPRGYSSM